MNTVYQQQYARSCKRVWLFILLMVSLTPAFADVFSIKTFGAIGDGKTVNTAAIQRTIDTCSRRGGGTVLVPAGHFITGTLHLKSNINLVLERDALLQGSQDLKDYDPFTLPGYGAVYYGMFYTADAENISITGPGTIDGNNEFFFNFSEMKKLDSVATMYTRQQQNFRKLMVAVPDSLNDGPVTPREMRPRQMILFSNCKNVSVLNVKLTNAPSWMLHFADCTNVKVSGVRMYSSMQLPNVNGIVISSCNKVNISGCDIRTGDDAITIAGYGHYSGYPGFTDRKHISADIYVTDCDVQSASAGIRIGYMDQNPVKNIHVSRVNITNSTRGIGIFVRDEGSLEDIYFSDIYIETKLRTGDWWGNGEPIHISAVRGRENVKLGAIRNVQFSNVACTGENGILLYGSDESRLQNISFQNVTMHVKGGKLNDIAGGNIDLRGSFDPKQKLFASVIRGLMARYTDGLNIHNFKVSWDNGITQQWYTNAISVENFKGFNLTGFSGKPAPVASGAHAVLLTNGENVNTDVGDVMRINVSEPKR